MDRHGDGEYLIRGYSGRIFLLVAIGVLAANLGRQALPPLLPTIIDDLAISAAAAGLAFTVMRICFAILQYPSGRVADVVSRKFAVMGGLVVFLLGFVLLTQSVSYPMFMASMVLLGGGAAFFFVSERVLLSDIFVSKRGRAFGFNSAFSRIGAILAAGLAVTTIAIGPWQLAFIPVILLLVGLVIAFHFVSLEPYRVEEIRQLAGGTAHVRTTVRRVFGTAEIRLLVVAYTLIIFTWEGVLTFLPTYLQVSKGLSPWFASGGFAALFAVGIIVQPAAGAFSDRWDRRVIAGIATVTSILGLAVLLLAGSILSITAGIVLYAAGLMAFTPVLQAYLMDIFPESSKGGDLGAFKTIYEGLSSLGPTYVGVVAGVAGFGVAFGGFLVCLAVSAIILVWLYINDRRTGVNSTLTESSG